MESVWRACSFLRTNHSVGFSVMPKFSLPNNKSLKKWENVGNICTWTKKFYTSYLKLYDQQKRELTSTFLQFAVIGEMILQVDWSSIRSDPLARCTTT